MFEKNVWRCGAVDITDDSGLARRGMIRDLVPSHGLIIDFGYSDHRVDLTPFRQCTIPPRKDPFYTGDGVETLLRCSVNEPWCWYPSKLLAGSWDTYAFVEVLLNGQIIREVQPVERVRRADHSVLPGDEEYYKHSVGLWSTIPLPEEYLQISNEKLLKIWNQATGTVAVTVTEQRKLEYISMRAAPLTDVEIPQKLAIAEEVCINKYFPQEVLRTVFVFLDVDTQVQCIQVCSYWNHVLYAARTSFHVQIDLAKCGIPKLASILYRMVTASTTVLVLTSSSSFPYRPVLQEAGCSFPIRTVTDMLKAMGIRLPMIVIARWHVWADELLDISGAIVKIRSEWAQICCKLVLKKILVYGLLDVTEETRRQYRDVWFDSDREGRIILRVVKGIINVNGVLGTGGLLGLLGASQTRRNHRVLVYNLVHKA